MKLDSHQHFWIVGKFDYPWLTPERKVLHRDYLPADFAPLLRRAEFDHTILVQASPSVAETDWLLELAVKLEALRKQLSLFKS
jgi:L-fuconolactonase